MQPKIAPVPRISRAPPSNVNPKVKPRPIPIPSKIDEIKALCDEYGVILIEAEDVDEETLMEAALEAGAEDFEADGDVFTISTHPNELGAVRDALEAAGYDFVSAEVEYVPNVETKLTDPDSIKNMEKLIDMLEDNDDVQAIWHNWAMDEE